MPWLYKQSTGELFHDGVLAGTGYSGHGQGVNNPKDQDVLCVGPIPRGEYEVGSAFVHPTTGPISMRLSPLPGTDTFGRSGFLIHGDNAQHDESASEGCIVVPCDVRQEISASTDRLLEVVA